MKPSSQTEFFIEVGGERKVKIFDPNDHDMFWRAYRVEYLVSDEKEIDKMKDSKYWDEAEFYCTESNEHISSAFVSLNPFDESKRLVIRGERNGKK